MDIDCTVRIEPMTYHWLDSMHRTLCDRTERGQVARLSVAVTTLKRTECPNCKKQVEAMKKGW